MQEKLDERRAESHGISHRNPGHLALANPTLYSARDSGKANTQVTEPPINTDPDQESSGSLMLQTPFSHFINRGSGALSASCTQLSSAKGTCWALAPHAYSPPLSSLPVLSTHNRLIT